MSRITLGLTALSLLLLFPALAEAQASERTTEAQVRRTVKKFLDATNRKEGFEAMSREADKVVACGEPAVQYLRDGIGAREPQSIVWSIRVLMAIGDPSFVEDLPELSRHSDAKVRVAALQAGLDTAPKKMKECFIRATKDPDGTVRRRAYDGLLECPCDESTLSLIIEGLVDEDYWISARSFNLLARWPKMGPEDREDPLFKPLLKVISQIEPGRTHQVISFMARRDRHNIGPLLTIMEKKGDTVLKVETYKMARKHRARDLVGPARQAIADSQDDKIRLEAVKYLGEMKDDQALSDLARLLSSRDEALREAAAVSLRKISGQLFGFDREAWENWIAGR